jgi:hypothetical protein
MSLAYTQDPIIYVSIHPVTTKIRAFFLTQLSERKETAQGFHHEVVMEILTQGHSKSILN